MTTEIHLDKDDIKQAIAKSFDVEPDSVYIECYMDYEGYGLNEQKVPNVRAIITEKSMKEPKNEKGV